MPLSIRDEVEDIYLELSAAQTSKKDSRLGEFISRLEELVTQYPHQPKISNFLVAAYRLTQNPKSKALVRENYEKHPDYLFARVHYANQCLDNNEIGEIKEIFKEGLDLKLLYPQRKRFHVSEFVGFAALMCRYYVIINEDQAAKLILQGLEQVAPDHPATKQSKRIIKGGFLIRLQYKVELALGNQNKQPTDANKPSSFEA